MASLEKKPKIIYSFLGVGEKKVSYLFEQSFTDRKIMIGNLELFMRLRERGIEYASLPELMSLYLEHSSLFKGNQNKEISLITDTNEILGIDFDGSIYNKNEKLIVHTHGVCVQSDDKTKRSKHILSEDEFSELINGLTPDGEKIKVYKEENLKNISKTPISSSCITIIKGDKYFKDPYFYCNELNNIEFESEFKKNNLLTSRTLQKPNLMKQFINNNVTYFSQVNPLLEPVILSNSNKLFEKYALRVMPLMLRDGEIAKDAPDKFDIFNDNKNDNKKTESEQLFLALIKYKT